MIARLFLLAHGRSGDKGDSVNIGVIARRQEWYPYLVERVSRKNVAEFLSPLAQGPVERYELPHLGALNFVVRRALGGGGSRSLRLDAQGKTYAQTLLRMPLRLPDDLAREVIAFWGDRMPKGCVTKE